ncbi:ribonuclease III [Hypoxylon sp. FL1284]|nr:ribonuclease III [Hypoxylon sp. FL1284]
MMHNTLKRSHSKLTSKDAPSVSQILEHAEGLLQAAKALKKQLETHHNTAGKDASALSILEHHNKEIASAAQLLAQDEIDISHQRPSGSQKIRKIDGNHESSGRSSAALPVPSPILLTGWTLQDIASSDLPPLPPIRDPLLEQAALTHSGMVMHLSEMSYERLEWIGDAYLYLMSTSFIYQTFPKLATGRSAQLRERLIRNEALSHYTVRYGINKRARLPAEFAEDGRAGGSQATGNAKKKVLGDIFEAYVAAMILGDPDGLSRATPWLKSLWGAQLAHEIRSELRAPPALVQDGWSRGEGNGGAQNAAALDPAPKVALSQVIGTKGVRITYSDIGEPKKDKHTGKLPWFTVGAFLDGLGERNLQLGVGSALSKKEAGAIAARRALENKGLISRLVKKKEEAVKAAQLAETAKEEYDNWS